ncbi:MAG: DNA gyrase inhibitor YacG [Myxococcota bacterium]
MRRVATTMPDPVVRLSGSPPRFPTRMTLFTDMKPPFRSAQDRRREPLSPALVVREPRNDRPHGGDSGYALGVGTPRCPICGVVLGSASVRSGPFCSARCKMVDLDRWLSGDYHIPGEPASPEDSSSDSYGNEPRSTDVAPPEET